PFMVLVEGRFDPAKLQAGAKKFAKAMSERGGTSIYEIAPLGSSIFAAVLDKGHVLLAPQKEQVETALDKATGKKKTGLKSKAFAELLRKIDPEKSLSLIATGDMVVGGGGSIEQGPDGKVIRRDYKLFTLG